jgi:hypothetical protein
MCGVLRIIEERLLVWIRAALVLNSSREHPEAELSLIKAL